MKNHSTFKIDIAKGQSLRIGDAVLTVLEKSGSRARLQIQAPSSVVIKRQSCAQECASTPEKGKEHTNGKYLV